MRRKSENPSPTPALAATLVGLVFLSCSPSSPTDPGQTQGQIQVDVSTSGTGVPSSFTVTLTGGASRSVSPNGSVTYASLDAGNYTVALGVPGNCTISGSSERNVGVQESSTSTVAYSVSCSAVPTGAIGVTTGTTGSPADPDGYTVSIDGSAAGPIGVNDNLLIPDLGLGDHEIELSGVADNCLVQGANPRNVSVSEDQTTPAEFEVVCSATTGRIDVTVTTTGAALDPDGYDVALDGGAVTREVDPNGSAEFTGVEQGERTLELDDVASNCTVMGENPAAVEVVAGETVAASFTVECEATTGGLEVSATTTGDEPDANGYAVSVDGGLEQSIGVNGSTTFPDLPPGDHEVELTGVAGNCAVGGANPRTVEVVAGQTASTNFDIACSSTVGSIEATVTTTGDAIDADGYSLVLDGGASTQFVDANDTAVFGGLAPGEHTLDLGNVAGNCTVTSDNPATVDVTAGAQESVAFTVECEELTGDIQVNMSTTGDDPDASYTVRLDGGTGLSVSSNGSRTFSDVVIGEHEIEIGDVAGNCAVQGSNPRDVTVNENQTTQVDFDVACSATAGSIEVTVTTTGEDQDDSYFIVVDGGASQLVDANDMATFGGLAPGEHTVGLDDVADNCDVAGANPRTVSVVAGQTENVSFAVDCTRTTGDIRVTTSTSGMDLNPSDYEVTVSGVGTRSIGKTDEDLFEDLEPGGYTVELTDVAVNCTVSGGAIRNPTVTADDEELVAYEISCVPLVGDLRVNVSTTGDDPDTDGYEARLDGDPGTDLPVGSNGSVTFSDVSTGNHSVTLVDATVADNCEIVGPDSKSTTVEFDAIVDLDFDVTCVELTGSVKVNVVTSGEDLDTQYTATLSGGQGSQAVPANGSVTFNDVPTGNYTVTITDNAANCTDDDGDDQESVTVTENTTANADFSYTCTSTTGSIDVDVSTSGVDQDPNGYTITLNGGTPRSVGINGGTTYSGLTPDDYLVGIDETTVADNCTVNETNPQTESVTAANTSNVSFTVECEQRTGSVQVNVTTDGEDLDTQYTATLSGGQGSQAVPANGSVTFNDAPIGNYTVTITDNAANCTDDDGDDQQPVTVTENATANADFSYTCTSTTGSIMVTTTTTGTGTHDPNGYFVALDGGTPTFIDDATPVPFNDLSPISHTVELSGLDGTCIVVAPPSNPATPTVIAGDTVSVDFNVDCP